MATQGERIEALEKAGNDFRTAIDEINELLAKAAPLSDFNKLTAIVEAHGEILGLSPEVGFAGEPIKTAGFDAQGELLKAFRQIEAISNHLNIRLPA